MKFQTISLCIVLWCTVGCIRTQYVYQESTIHPSPYPAPTIASSTVKSYVEAMNAIRSQGRYCGRLGYFPAAPPLRWNYHLYRAAYEHSQDMAQANMFRHTGSYMDTDWTSRVQRLGHASTFKERIENNGYLRWRHLAQNIAAGKATLAETMEQWITSPYHCKNIMNPVLREFGMAYAFQKGTDYRYYWTQNFARHQ